MLSSGILSSTEVRRTILELIDPAAQSFPERPTVAFVWPTNLCSIGCAHCNFASKKTGIPTKQLLASHPEQLTQWLAAAGTRKVIICGGGEPLDEPEFITRTISACAMLGLECALYTSGVSRRTPIAVADTIRQWRRAWALRIRQEHRLGIRLSVDVFHEELIGLEPVLGPGAARYTSGDVLRGDLQPAWRRSGGQVGTRMTPSERRLPENPPCLDAPVYEAQLLLQVDVVPNSTEGGYRSRTTGSNAASRYSLT